MKKLFVTLMALAAFQAHAYSSGNTSQTKYLYNPETSGSAVHLTPTLGLAAMSLKSSNASTDTDMGISAGGYVELGDSMVTFQTGLLYNQFGGKVSALGQSASINLSYLSVPLLAKFNVNGSAEQSFFLRMGVMPGFLVSKTAKAGGQSETIDEGLKSFDIPMVIGLGAAIPTNSDMSISIGADYIRGLTSVASEGEIRNEGFLLSAGVVLAM